MRRITILVCCLAIFTDTPAQDSLTTEIVQQYAYPLLQQGNKLAGPGWDSLKRDIAGSQFVLLGENHSSPSLSELTAALLEEMRSVGFKHFIIETGPVASGKIKKLYNRDPKLYLQHLHDFLSRYKLEPGSPPAEFMAMKTDPAMYASAIRNGYSIQGIDKEYMASYHYLFDELLIYCGTPALKDLHAAALQRLLDYNAQRLADEKFTLSLHCQADSTIQHFLNTLNRNVKARPIVSAIRQSWEIYGLYESRNYYQSEQTRIALLKRNFGNYYYANSQKSPFKAFFKYGNVHTQRGDSYLGYPDLGNMVSELAALNGTRSLHIMNMRRYRYDNRDSVLDFANDGYEVYPNIISLADKQQWILVDLQPLRKMIIARKIKVAPEERALIIKNDWVLLTPLDGAHRKSFNYE